NYTRVERFRLFYCLDAVGATNRATHSLSPTLLLLRRYQTTTICARRIFLLMLLTKLCAPIIEAVFAYQWFPTIGTMRSNELAIAFSMIRCTIVQEDALTPNGTAAARTKKMFWMPYRS